MQKYWTMNDYNGRWTSFLALMNDVMLYETFFLESEQNSNKWFHFVGSVALLQQYFSICKSQSVRNHTDIKFFLICFLKLSKPCHLIPELAWAIYLSQAFWQSIGPVEYSLEIFSIFHCLFCISLAFPGQKSDKFEFEMTSLCIQEGNRKSVKTLYDTIITYKCL